MANDGRNFCIQTVATADLSTGDGTGAQYKAVQINGTISAANNTAIGLLQNKPKSGEDMQIGYMGHLKGVAGAAITQGSLLMVTTSGYLITRAGGVIPCGRALAAAASGAAVEGVFNFTVCGVNSA